MKFLLLLASASLLLAADPAPATFCRFVPERSDDFAWENDRIAFRAYGPALRGKTEDSGIDCWLKRVPYPIIDRWYAGHLKGVSYHTDHGEGNDPYHTGASRGTGGTGLWVDDHLVLAGPYTAWSIATCTPAVSTFTLTYRYPAAAGEEPIVEAKTITIALGEDTFTATSTFTRAGVPLVGLAVAAGVTTHDGKGTATLDPEGRWLSVWEVMEGQGLGTGVALPAKATLREVRDPAVKDRSNVLALLTTDAAGQIRLRAGYGWAKAGRITTPEAWHQALQAAAAGF